ncbi:hypothetical protein [Escherichia coli]|uniref:hypothetical protein n=1 Tax=Escherichia coli TaxID=562 RepID=UPI0038D3CEFD
MKDIPPKYTLALCCSSADAGCYSYRELGLQGNSSVTFFIAHVHILAENRWIENIRKGKRSSIPWWGHMYGVLEV